MFFSEEREAWLWLGLPGSLSSSFYIVNLLVFFSEEREAWLWLGLPGSLSSSFYIVNLLVFLRQERLGCGLVSRGLSRPLFI